MHTAIKLEYNQNYANHAHKMESFCTREKVSPAVKDDGAELALGCLGRGGGHGKEVSPGSRSHRREELGGGEGLCLHLLLPAGPGLASPSSRRGGRKHLATAVGPIWGWWWPRSHRIPRRRRWIWRFIAGLDRKVQYFSEVRRGLVEGSTTTRLKVKESAAMRAKVDGRGEERILAASRSRARRRQAHRRRRRRVRKEEGERELSSRE